MRRLLAVLGTLLVVGAVTPVAAVHAAAPEAKADRSAAARCGAWAGNTLSAKDKQAVRATRAAVDEVFEGRVSLPRKPPAHGSLRLSVHVLATWKGTVQPQTTVAVTFGSGACRTWTLAHPVHEEYLFFVDRTSTGGLAADGNQPRIVAHTAALTQVLGRTTGTTPAPPPPPVTFTPTDAAAPRPFLKAAAPGIAMLIIGVLGLIVVGTIGRRAV